MHPEKFKYSFLNLAPMHTGGLFKDIVENVKLSKKINKNEISKTTLRTGENLRLAIEEIEHRYKISQRKATIAMIEYGAGWIYSRYHEKIADIYELREKIRLARINDPGSVHKLIVSRLIDSLKIYMNDLTNIRPISAFMYRKDYDYLGGVARAVGADLSSILRLAMYTAADAEGIGLFRQEIDRFRDSIEINRKILKVLIKFLESGEK